MFLGFNISQTLTYNELKHKNRNLAKTDLKTLTHGANIKTQFDLRCINE